MVQCGGAADDQDNTSFWLLGVFAANMKKEKNGRW